MPFLFFRRLRQQLKRFVGNVSLSTVLIVPFLLQVVLTVSLVGYFSFRNGEEAVQDLASQLRNELTARINQRLQTYVRAPHSINRLNVDSLVAGDLNFKTGAGSNQFLQQIKIASYVNAVYCGDRDTGNFIGVSRTDDGAFFELMLRNSETDGRMHLYGIDVRADRLYFLRDVGPYDPRDRPWYRVAQAAGQPKWSDIYLDFTTQLPTITASLAAYDNWGNQFVGVCGTDVLLTEELREFLKKLEIGKTGEAFIMDRSGLLVSSSTDDPITLGTDDDAEMLKATESLNPLVRETAKYLLKNIDNLRNIRRSRQLDVKILGKRQFVQVLPFNDGRGLDWSIVLVIPESDFMAQIHASKINTILICVAVVILSIFFNIKLAKWIDSPISHLSRASQAIAQGDLTQHVRSESIRELRLLSQSFNTMSRQLRESFDTLEKRVEERTFELNQEKEKSEKLLLNILPKPIADRLKKGEKTIASAIGDVTILFADIVGFTPLSARVPPIELVKLLNEMFSRFDELSEHYNLEKIKTIGDAYMVVGGLQVYQENHAALIADMAIDMQRIMAEFDACQIFGNLAGCDNFQIRIGINTGPVVAGVIGIQKFSYDLWGNAVNIASRMESSGEPGRIQVTDITYERLKYRYKLQPRGTIFVKGKGYMTTYWLIGKS